MQLRQIQVHSKIIWWSRLHIFWNRRPQALRNIIIGSEHKSKVDQCKNKKTAYPGEAGWGDRGPWVKILTLVYHWSFANQYAQIAQPWIFTKDQAAVSSEEEKGVIREKACVKRRARKPAETVRLIRKEDVAVIGLNSWSLMRSQYIFTHLNHRLFLLSTSSMAFYCTCASRMDLMK